MRVGYDEQIFLAQRHGGIVRYVVNLIEAFRQDPELGGATAAAYAAAIGADWAPA